VSATNARFKPGDQVKVRFEDRPGHIRTPWYIRGKRGRVEHVHGEFLNPESLGHGGDGLPKRPLYLVSFKQADVWGRYGPSHDKLLVDIYEHWLDRANEGA
jgi:nitrile hydratase subunit beta